VVGGAILKDTNLHQDTNSLRINNHVIILESFIIEACHQNTGL